ncbi:Papain family cysteine protease [Bifidobacterium lemurum]|uniref:Papain family cysteine protease n=1 Tax=Bifidobacterium lemurum TaxID=1603886 RepID=A0A261FRV2_9BIFI|nr:lectin like domain-containing protein [Bifidobacterium lemurum]OZG61920.1 Papain family cysteine protease [Bifidobacterium lemurum]QOL35297.1 hypothetical protein BL8807_05470 [Bifidobacterium lemurum]
MKHLGRAAIAALSATILTCAGIAPTAFADPTDLGFTDDATGSITNLDTTQRGSAGLHANPNLQALYNYDPDQPSAIADLPASYDLRKEGQSTSVKNQGYWGTCWAFGTLASLESNLIKQGAVTDGTEPDLSELQLAWFSYTPMSQETYKSTDLLTSPMDLSDQIGEGTSFITSGENALPLNQMVLNFGGNDLQATNTLSSWQGATTESEIPYSLIPDTESPNYSPDAALSDELRTLSQVHVQNIDYLPLPATFKIAITPDITDYTEYYEYDPAATDAIKRALMDTGAVSLGYYATLYSKDYNVDNAAQYVGRYVTSEDGSTVANHGVTIVGWNDNYPASNFTTMPPGNGAWIVKNSWGTDIDSLKEGYFYLSYYDMTISQASTYQADVPQDSSRTFSYDHNYQYDFLSTSSYYIFYPGEWGNKARIANVFTTQGTEQLEAISAVTANPGSKVSYEVYRLNADSASPTDGTLVANGTEVVEYAGYHTLVLDNPVALEAGERFSVVETIEGRDGRYVPIEAAATDYDYSDYTLHQEAKVSAGQSYVSQDDGVTWTDAASIEPGTGTFPSSDDTIAQFMTSELNENGEDEPSISIGNVMIKAFTTDRDPSDTPEDPESPEEPTDSPKDATASDEDPLPATGADWSAPAAVCVLLFATGLCVIGIRRVATRV